LAKDFLDGALVVTCALKNIAAYADELPHALDRRHPVLRRKLAGDGFPAGDPILGRYP
jgi:hypothetical protein